MAYARLEFLANRVRDDLERHFERKRSRIEDALRHLLRLIVTAEAPEELEDLACAEGIRGLRTHARELAAYLGEQSQMPECLCARYKYKMSEARARKRYRIGERAWSYVHRLAREVDWDLDLVLPFVDYEVYDWHDDLEESFVMVDVVLDRGALDDMLLCVLEGYLSPKKSKRKGYEVYGMNLGMIREVPARKRGAGVTITRYVSVMHSQPQLSAHATHHDVEPNEKSLRAILRATSTLYPQYQVVGDFHSHPYDDSALLEESKGWEFTEGDEEANIDLVRTMSDLGHSIETTFIIGIARSGKRVERRHYRGRENTMQLSLGECRVIIAAYRSLESGRYSGRNIRLRLPGI